MGSGPQDGNEKLGGSLSLTVSFGRQLDPVIGQARISRHVEIRFGLSVPQQKNSDFTRGHIRVQNIRDQAFLLMM